MRQPIAFGLLALLMLPFGVSARQAEESSAAMRAAESVCDKQVVVLGELPSHGEALAFKAKARIVEHLVTECGFDAVLFEAPVYDFVGFQQAVEDGSATAAQLDKSIGRFWWTRELADWRQWLFRRAMDDGLVLGGLDDQVSATSEYARRTLPGLVAASLSPESAAACRAAVDRNLYWRYNADDLFDEREKVLLEQCASDAAGANGPGASADPRAPEQVMLENFANLSSRQRDAATARDRDEAMYRNVRWYTDRMPAGSKVIIWTATVHAARQQGTLRQRPLGAWLAERDGSRLAAIGFTALGGESSMAGGAVRTLAEAPADSLEALSLDAGADWRLLDRAGLQRLGEVPSRLLGRFTSADWSRYFDYVIVVRQEVAPVAIEEEQP